jgi:putative membrane protein insertion efficiency factor
LCACLPSTRAFDFGGLSSESAPDAGLGNSEGGKEWKPPPFENAPHLMVAERVETPPVGGGSSAFQQHSCCPKQATPPTSGAVPQVPDAIAQTDRSGHQAEDQRISRHIHRASSRTGTMAVFFHRISRGPQRVVMVLIRGYQLLASPFPSPCRYYPSCSAYALEAVSRHGTLKGSWLGFRRILRCHPFKPGGIDPVPE